MFDGHMYGLGGVFMWLFWFLLIMGIVWIVKMLANPKDGSTGRTKSALEILQERYATGEIDQEEYEHKKRVLSD